jgi:hypothetical protein
VVGDRKLRAIDLIEAGRLTATSGHLAEFGSGSSRMFTAYGIVIALESSREMGLHGFLGSLRIVTPNRIHDGDMLFQREWTRVGKEQDAGEDLLELTANHCYKIDDEEVF